MQANTKRVMSDKEREAVLASLKTVATNNSYNEKQRQILTFGALAALEAVVVVPAGWYLLAMSGREIFTVDKRPKIKEAV